MTHGHQHFNPAWVSTDLFVRPSGPYASDMTDSWLKAYRSFEQGINRGKRIAGFPLILHGFCCLCCSFHSIGSLEKYLDSNNQAGIMKRGGGGGVMRAILKQAQLSIPNLLGNHD